MVGEKEIASLPRCVLHHLFLHHTFCDGILHSRVSLLEPGNSGTCWLSFQESRSTIILYWLQMYFFKQHYSIYTFPGLPYAVKAWTRATCESRSTTWWSSVVSFLTFRQKVRRPQDASHGPYGVLPFIPCLWLRESIRIMVWRQLLFVTSMSTIYSPYLESPGTPWKQ